MLHHKWSSAPPSEACFSWIGWRGRYLYVGRFTQVKWGSSSLVSSRKLPAILGSTGDNSWGKKISLLEYEIRCQMNTSYIARPLHFSGRPSTWLSPPHFNLFRTYSVDGQR